MRCNYLESKILITILNGNNTDLSKIPFSSSLNIEALPLFTHC